MITMTESYVTYKSFYDAMEELTDEQYGRIMRAIDRYVYYGEETALSGIEKMAFTFMKPQIDANIKRKEYAEKGGRPVQKQAKQTKTPGAADAVIIEKNTSVSLGYETEKPADTQTENLRICNQETLGYENAKPNVNGLFSIRMNKRRRQLMNISRQCIPSGYSRGCRCRV